MIGKDENLFFLAGKVVQEFAVTFALFLSLPLLLVVNSGTGFNLDWCYTSVKIIALLHQSLFAGIKFVSVVVFEEEFDGYLIKEGRNAETVVLNGCVS